MIKVYTAFILALLLLAIAGPVMGEEMAREGSISGRTYWTGTFCAYNGQEMCSNKIQIYLIISNRREGLPITPGICLYA
jgi:hypothetical protein